MAFKRSAVRSRLSPPKNLETTTVSRFSFCPDRIAVLCSSNAFLTAKHAPLHFPASSRQALPCCLSAPWPHLPVTTAIPPAARSTTPPMPTVPAASSPRGTVQRSLLVQRRPAPLHNGEKEEIRLIKNLPRPPVRGGFFCCLTATGNTAGRCRTTDPRWACPR